MAKILLMHPNVPQKEIIRSSILNDIELIESDTLLIPSDTSIQRIGIMWDNVRPTFPFGLPNNTFFTQSFYDFVASFEQPIRIDLITCFLGTDEIKSEITQLCGSYPNVQIEYSINATGSTPNSDWIMESNGESIRAIYFNDGIDLFQTTLGSSGSSSHTILIRYNGIAYSCGNNSSGQLADGGFTSRQSILQMQIHSSVSIPIGNARHASEGTGFSAVLYEYSGVNTLFTCGNNTSGQLGRYFMVPIDRYEYLMPVDPVPSGLKPITMACGGVHMVVIFLDELTNLTYLYSCGSNTFGQLGLGPGSNPTYFNLSLMDTTNVTSGYYPKKVSCGTSHTIVLYRFVF